MFQGPSSTAIFLLLIIFPVVIHLTQFKQNTKASNSLVSEDLNSMDSYLFLKTQQVKQKLALHSKQTIFSFSFMGGDTSTKSVILSLALHEKRKLSCPLLILDSHQCFPPTYLELRLPG